MSTPESAAVASRGGSVTDRLRGAWAGTRHFRPVLVLVVVLFIVFSITQSDFFDRRNLENMLTAVSVLWVVSMGMTFVTITGGFDLSVGAIAALVGIFLGKMLNDVGAPAGLTVVLAVLMGTLIGGIINGGLIGRLNLSFFVVTLATMTGLTGVVNLWSKTETETIVSPLISRIGVERTLGVPTPIWIMAIVFVVALFVQRRTYFGRDIYAVGGSMTAARLSGIRTARTVMLVYAIVGGCAALGGIIGAGRIGAATPQVNIDLPLQAAAAVLLGGTALAGGAGGVGGTALGVLFIGILQNGLSIAGVQSFWQQVVTGVILVAAVLGDRVSAQGGVALVVTRARRLATRRRLEHEAPAAGTGAD
jgi:ribose transport system permease protein